MRGDLIDKKSNYCKDLKQLLLHTSTFLREINGERRPYRSLSIIRIITRVT